MPIRSKQWILTKGQGLDALQMVNVEVPTLGHHDVLVRFRAASINYRDLAMALGTYPRALKPGLVPGSDGAGEVVEVGPGVTDFKPGDRVMTCFFQDYVAGKPTRKRLGTALGSDRDGVFREYGIFPVHGLVAVPPSLSWREAATLSCAALTAWACLYGERKVAPGDVVMIQGTGGVSLFGLQFAAAAGARVIATTSSDEKAELLKRWGAHSVVNYKNDTAWGESARKLSPHRQGCDIILDVGGPSNWAQSFKAIRESGDIHLIGFLSGTESASTSPSLWEARQLLCNVKSAFVGSRAQFEDMNRAVEAFQIKPIIDSVVFDIDHLKDAYQYSMNQKHMGKIVIDIGTGQHL